jgi:AAA domain
MPLYSGPFRPAADTQLLYQDRDPWFLPGLIAKDSVVVLASGPKTGKTCFASALARAVATGSEFLGHKFEKSPVLWCSHEETPWQRTILHEGLTLEDPLLVAYPDTMPALDDPAPKPDRFGRLNTDGKKPYVFEHAVEVGAKLIVIDCLHAAVERGCLSDNALARKVMGRLARWSFNFHVPVLVLHHLTKSATRGHNAERFADSTQILAAATAHFFLERTQLPDGTNRITLFGRGRHPSPEGRIDLHSKNVLHYERIASPDLQSKETTEDFIQDLLADGEERSAKEIAERLHISYGTVRNCLTHLLQSDTVERVRTKDRQGHYRLVGA